MNHECPSRLPELLSGLLPVAALLLLLPALDLGLRGMALVGVAIGSAAAAQALTRRPGLVASGFRLLAALSAAASLATAAWLFGAWTGWFAGPVHALLAAFTALALLDASEPTPLFDALLALAALPILVLYSTAGLLDLLPALFVAAAALSCRLRRRTQGRLPALLFVLPLVLPLLCYGINALPGIHDRPEKETIPLFCDGFAVFTDPLAGTGVAPRVGNWPSRETLPPVVAAEWTLPLPGFSGRVSTGRRSLASGGLAGSIVLAEIDGREERPEFLPDLLRFFPGRRPLPWTERDALTLQLVRGWLGAWRIRDVRVTGYRFHLLPDRPGGNGLPRTLAGGDNGIALLEASMDSGEINLLCLTQNGDLRRIVPLDFDPVGLRWCGGPAVFGTKSDPLTGKMRHLAAFFSPAGDFRHGLQGDGPIHELLSLPDGGFILCHGPWLQRFAADAGERGRVQRRGAGPLLAVTDKSGGLDAIDFLTGRLLHWDGSGEEIVDRGVADAQLLARGGGRLWLAAFGAREIRCPDDGETHETQLPVHWLAAAGEILFVGLQDGRVQRLGADASLEPGTAWIGTLPPQPAGERLLTRRDGEILLTDPAGRAILRFHAGAIP